MEEHVHSTGGRLCLEFTNTASARDTGTPTERLHSYADLVAWGEREGVLPASLAAQLAEIADRNPQKARAALQSAIELREALYRIFTAHARRKFATGRRPGTAQPHPGAGHAPSTAHRR